MREIVLLVGASTRAMAESATRAGYACRSVDYYGDIDQSALVPTVAVRPESGEPAGPAGLLRMAGRVVAAAVAYGGALENHPDVVAALARGRELLGNGPEALRGVRDPAALADALRGAGVGVPRLLEDGSPRSDISERRWLLKKRRSAGGIGVRAWRPGEPVGAGEVVQEYVEGSPASAVAVGDGRGAIVLGLSRQLIGVETFGASGFRYCGSVLPLTEDEDEHGAVLAQLERAAQAITAAFGVRGVFGIDFVCAAGLVQVLEVNPRYTASMELVERDRGLSIFDLHVHGCRGRLPVIEPPPRRGAALGKAILFAGSTLRLGDTRTWPDRGMRDVPRPWSQIAAGSPICTVFATAPSPDGCERALRAAARESSLVRPHPVTEAEVHSA